MSSRQKPIKNYFTTRKNYWKTAINGKQKLLGIYRLIICIDNIVYVYVYNVLKIDLELFGFSFLCRSQQNFLPEPRCINLYQFFVFRKVIIFHEPFGFHMFYGFYVNPKGGSFHAHIYIFHIGTNF